MLREALADVLGFTSAVMRRLARALNDLPTFARMSSHTLDVALRASDSVLFPRIYATLFPLFVRHHKAADASLRTTIEQLRARSLRVQFDLFGASARFCASIETDIAAYEPCVRAVAQLAACTTPARKLEQLVAACRFAETQIARCVLRCRFKNCVIILSLENIIFCVVSFATTLTVNYAVRAKRLVPTSCCQFFVMHWWRQISPNYTLNLLLSTNSWSV